MSDTDRQTGYKGFYNQALDRAIAYRLSFAQKETRNFQALEYEMPNLLETVRQCYQQKAWERVSAFYEALHAFLDLRGYYEQSLMLNEWACEAARSLGETMNAVRWTHERADMLHQQGKYHDAERLYQACEEAYRALCEEEMALKSCHMRSMVVHAQGRFAEAQRLCEITIDEARDLGQDHWLAHPLYELALLARDQGNFRKAELWIEESLLRLVDTDETALLAQCHHFLGEVALQQGELAKARKQLERSLRFSQQAGSVRRIASTQRLLGDLARIERRYEEAEKMYNEASGVFSLLDDRYELARLLFSKARLFSRLHQSQLVGSLLSKGISLYIEMGDPGEAVRAAFSCVWLFLRQGQWGQALRTSLMASRVAQTSGLLHPRQLLKALKFRI